MLRGIDKTIFSIWGCGENEVLSDCHADCQNTCSSPTKQCTETDQDNCKSGCICKHGYVRHDDKWTCIKQSDCPKTQGKYPYF